ncbi:uncharacterized protein M6D78_005010 [Vipera latastei]
MTQLFTTSRIVPNAAAMRLIQKWPWKKWGRLSPHLPIQMRRELRNSAYRATKAVGGVPEAWSAGLRGGTETCRGLGRFGEAPKPPQTGTETCRGLGRFGEAPKPPQTSAGLRGGTETCRGLGRFGEAPKPPQTGTETCRGLGTFGEAPKPPQRSAGLRGGTETCRGLGRFGEAPKPPQTGTETCRGLGTFGEAPKPPQRSAGLRGGTETCRGLGRFGEAPKPPQRSAGGTETCRGLGRFGEAPKPPQRSAGGTETCRGLGRFGEAPKPPQRSAGGTETCRGLGRRPNLPKRRQVCAEERRPAEVWGGAQTSPNVGKSPFLRALPACFFPLRKEAGRQGAEFGEVRAHLPKPPQTSAGLGRRWLGRGAGDPGSTKASAAHKSSVSFFVDWSISRSGIFQPKKWAEKFGLYSSIYGN